MAAHGVPCFRRRTVANLFFVSAGLLTKSASICMYLSPGLLAMILFCKSYRLKLTSAGIAPTKGHELPHLAIGSALS